MVLSFSPDLMIKILLILANSAYTLLDRLPYSSPNPTPPSQGFSNTSLPFSTPLNTHSNFSIRIHPPQSLQSQAHHLVLCTQDVFYQYLRCICKTPPMRCRVFQLL
ncbi:hypothetical protein E1B28_009245 [Marasmius oreades]|uniref:Uncharacterized protein n=1 Tax=Marasmius oreades TaxID=181124 RepID=A0A9P7USZ1_9AGAR|nr:uncharacterized protein E1B28_009245 [Marasmius oreades]KAG7092943.1 hypothetical protein E1B28_009245 [Marasmius oreades]